MAQFKSVKTLLLISVLGFASIRPSYGESFGPKMECGFYDLHGTLDMNSSGHFILKAQENSYAPIEVILIGGSFSDKLRRRKTQVIAQVYVPKAIADNNAPIVFLQKLLPPALTKVDQPISLREKADCKLGDYFKQEP